MRGICLIFLLLAGAVQASGFHVQPVRMELPAGKTSTVLTVTNPSDQALRLQAEAFHWRQVAGEDVLEPAPGLLLNPPIFEIKPGAKQLIRLGFKPGYVPPVAREASYRILLSQLPVDDAASATPQGVRLLFRLNLPVFLAPAAPPRVEPVWQVESGQLVLHNAGNRHLQLHRVLMRDESGGQWDLPMRYVLAGSTIRWPLPADRQGRTLSLEASSNVGDLTSRVALPVAP
jgi:fimbrial chaperone protein